MNDKPDGAVRGYRLLEHYQTEVDPQPQSGDHLSALVRAMGDLMLVARDLELTPEQLVTEVRFGMELRGIEAQAFE